MPVVVVGGGAPLCGASLRGASAVVRPRHTAVANAVGAAIAQVSGSVDAVYDMGGTAASRTAVLQQAQRLAERRAAAAGAVPGSCRVAVREDVPLAYLPGSFSRVRVEVIGDLDLSSLDRSAATPEAAAGGGASDSRAPTEGPAPGWAAGRGAAGRGAAAAADREVAEQRPAAAASGGISTAAASSASSASEVAGWPPLAGRGEDPMPAQLAGWQPRVNQQGEWILRSEDLHLIATGCGILGCGGGGSPSKAMLKALMQLQR